MPAPPRSAVRPLSRPTGRQVAGGVGALGVLIIGLVGIPIALSALIGWPLPHHVPSGTQTAHALAASIPDSFWPRLFAILAWLAWAYFALSVVASLVTQLCGRRPVRHSRLYGSSAMATLVAAVLILGQLRGAHAARSGPLAQPVPVVRLLAQTTLAVVPPAPGSVMSASEPATVTHVVVPGDTLWSIAVQYYGDGSQWQGIYQANVGLPQPGGGALTDAHWIYPGWSLSIPGATQSSPAMPTTRVPAPTPSVAPAASPTPATAPTTSNLSQPGHHAAGHATSADHGPGSQDSEARVAPHPKSDVHATPEHRSHQDRSNHAGRDGGASSQPPLVLHRHDGSTSAHSEGSHNSHKTRSAAPATHGDDIGLISIGAGLFGLAAIGLVTALDRRRRRQIGRRSFGRHIPRPEPKSPLADLELQLRHYARAGQVFWVDHLAEILAHAAHIAGVATPEVVGVELGDHGLNVLLTSDSVDPPAPFEGRSDRPGLWHLPFTTDPGFVDQADAAPPLPLVLATTGQSATGTVLVNLDHYESVHITVDGERVEGMLSAMATELAGTTAPIGTTVIAVGFGYGVVDRLEGGLVVDDLDEATGLVRPDEKAIVLVDPRTTTDQLLDLLRGMANLHLVTAGPVAPVGTVLAVDPADPSLGDHTFNPVQPSNVSDDSLEEVQTLFELAEENSKLSPGGEIEITGPDGASGEPPVGKVTISILGEPLISIGDGVALELAQAVSSTAGTKARRVAELIVYLAAHDGTATRGEWLTDVSPEKALTDGYVRNLVLLTRRSLEAITGAPDLLAYDKATQRFTLAERVTADWRQFQSAASEGDSEGLRSALALVRGVPFGVDPAPWTSAGGLFYVLADSISDAALALGKIALGHDDEQLATWAARQGQLANRYDQGLWRVLLRAAGDYTTLQQIWHELHALLAVDGDPAADLEPATVDLFDSLSAPTRTASQVVVLQDDDDAVIPTREAV